MTIGEDTGDWISWSWRTRWRYENYLVKFIDPSIQIKVAVALEFRASPTASAGAPYVERRMFAGWAETNEI